MLGRMKYKEAVEKAVHLTAIGHTKVYLDDTDPDLPWAKVSAVESGGGFRLNGPTGVYLVSKEAGLEFWWPLDFEGRDANGRGVSLFDRDRLRSAMLKLPPKARDSLATFLQAKVLPEMAKRTEELRTALNQQNDSEDCVRGLIAFGRQKVGA